MGRILIDTDELRSLDAMWRSGADAMASLSSHVTGALVGTRLNTDDPGLRAARLGERENEVRRRLDQAAGAFRHDGGEFVALAGRVEAEQAVGGAASLAVAAIADWTLTGAGVSAVDLGAGVLAGLTGFAMAEGALDGLRRSGLDALHGVEQAVQQGLAVGRSVMDRSMGLLHDATQSLQDAVSSVVDRVTQLAEAAWQAIWGRLSSVFQSVVAGMELLVTTTGRIFTAAEQLLGAVGQWVVSARDGVLAGWSAVDVARFGLLTPLLGPYGALLIAGPPAVRSDLWTDLSFIANGLIHLPGWVWTYMSGGELSSDGQAWVDLLVAVPLLGTAIDLERYGGAALGTNLAALVSFFDGSDATTRAYLQYEADMSMRSWNRFLIDTTFGAAMIFVPTTWAPKVMNVVLVNALRPGSAEGAGFSEGDLDVVAGRAVDGHRSGRFVALGTLGLGRRYRGQEV